jgi:hypothetical protein
MALRNGAKSRMGEEKEKGLAEACACERRKRRRREREEETKRKEKNLSIFFYSVILTKNGENLKRCYFILKVCTGWNL